MYQIENSMKFQNLISVLILFTWQGDDLQVSCYYIDCNLDAHAISSAQVSVI